MTGTGLSNRMAFETLISAERGELVKWYHIWRWSKHELEDLVWQTSIHDTESTLRSGESSEQRFRELYR